MNQTIKFTVLTRDITPTSLVGSDFHFCSNRSRTNTNQTNLRNTNGRVFLNELYIDGLLSRIVLAWNFLYIQGFI
jgi:hypothetical protein